RGPIMKGIDRLTLEDAIKKQFRKLKLKGRYTPHSLRHTAGQLMYEKKIPLEIIQKTLRHADLRTTLVYAQRVVDNQYFKRLKRF
ncbi:MAG: tyrosine-type recombinase/integrase, partial [Cyclobacteriaceae bacterium]|nr:tyrosine-type recombinase/integrase [Cyclobacteriaceae bacterium]